MDNKVLNRDIWFFLTAFFVFSFVGWIFETSAVAIFKHHLTFRGYLFEGPLLSSFIPFLSPTSILYNVPTIWGLPMIEMYGFGGLIILLIFPVPNRHPLYIFIVGFIVLSLFEYVGSLFCEYVLQQVYWDYSEKMFNFQGRICLSSSIGWGFLSIFAVNYLEKIVEKYYLLFKKRHHFHALSIILLVSMLLCAIYKYILR